MARRRTNWQGSTFDITGSPSATDYHAIVSNATMFAQASAGTIIRIVGAYTVQIDRNTWNQVEGVQWYLGIHVVDPDLPAQSPSTEIDNDDWMWSDHGIVYLHSWSADGGTTIQTKHDLSPTHRFDVRAKRRVQDPAELRLAARVSTLAGTPGDYHIRGYARALLLEA